VWSVASGHGERELRTVNRGGERMLVLSREIGESVAIDNLTVTLVEVGERYVEVCVENELSGQSTLSRLPHLQYVEITPEVQVLFVAANGTTARIGFVAPRDMRIARGEFLESRS
jgi:sRNA-binding carbon storage regulator CsrA